MSAEVIVNIIAVWFGVSIAAGPLVGAFLRGPRPLPATQTAPRADLAA